MKSLLVAAAFSLAATEASAISRYDITKMTCAQVQAMVEADGAAILRYSSTSILRCPSMTDTSGVSIIAKAAKWRAERVSRP